MAEVQRTQMLPKETHENPRRTAYRNCDNSPKVSISSQLECHFRSVRQKIGETFVFLKVWDHSFEKSSSEEFLENFTHNTRHKKPDKGPDPTIPSKGSSKVILKPRRLSFEEQLQIRLARMASIAQTLRHMYYKEREHRLKLFKEVHSSQEQCLHLFEEMVRLYGVHYTEAVNRLQTEIDTLSYERQERENLLQGQNVTIKKQQQVISSVKTVLQREEEERIQVKHKLDILEKENEKLYMKALTLHENAMKSVDLMEQKESIMSELRTELDEESRSRHHLEVLLDIALNKVKYLEAQPASSSYPRHFGFSGFDGDPFGSLSSNVNSYLDLCSSQNDLHTSSEAHFLSDTMSSATSADTTVSEMSMAVHENVTKMKNSSHTLEDDHNGQSAKKRLRVPFLQFRRKSISMDSQALLDHSDVGTVNGSLAGSCQSFEIDGQNSSHEHVCHTESLNEAQGQLSTDSDQKIVKVKEKVRWFEKKMKVGEPAHNGKKAKKLQRASSFVYKPPASKGSFGSLAKDIGRKLKRKRRSKTIEIPRINFEDTNSLNDLGN